MKKTMRLWDIVLMNVTAIIGLRWIPIAASYGASSILLWALAGLMFFIPLGLVSAELATAWPEQGGMYVWIRKAFGERPAFLTSWFYWISNLFYYPSLLTFIAVTLAFVTRPSLAENKFFVCLVILGIFWSVTLLNCRGLALGKWLSSLGGTLGTLLPGAILILLGLGSAMIWKRPIPTDYSFVNWLPHLDSRANIAFLSTLMFAMAGIELTPIMAGETENPQRNFPLATAISAALIVGTYVLGTVATTFILEPGKVGAVSGIMDAIKLIADAVKIPGLLMAVAWMIIFGSFGGVSVWVMGPIKLLFESTKEGMLPPFFTELNEDGAPRNAMLVQAGLITLIALATSFLPSVGSIYQILVLMTTITYFLPYLLMFAAFLKLRMIEPEVPRPYRVPGGKSFAWFIALLGLFSVTLAIVLPFFPSADLKTATDVLLYEIEIGGGPLFFGWLGWTIFSRRERRENKVFEPQIR